MISRPIAKPTLHLSPSLTNLSSLPDRSIFNVLPLLVSFFRARSYSLFLTHKVKVISTETTAAAVRLINSRGED